MMNIEQIIKGFERTHITMDLRRYADNTYMADATADKFNTYRSGWVDAYANEAAAVEALQKENESLKWQKDNVARLGLKVNDALKVENAALQKELTHWKANHADLKERLHVATHRTDLPSDRLPLFDKMKAEMATLQKENAELKEDLQFVERWANHHGTKQNITAQEALLCIQHYPSIAAITKSYKDGVNPTTRNPYAEIESLRQQLERSNSIFNFLASHNAKDADGYELGIVRIKLTEHNGIQQWLWVSSDLREVHAAMGNEATNDQ